MKKTKNLFLFIIIVFSLILNGCFFLPTIGGTNNSNDSSNSNQIIENFEFVTDDKMIYKDTTENKYYNLILYAGEEYQVKTTIDDILGDNYYLKYITDDEIAGKLTLSETGYIKINSDLQTNETIVIDVELYKKGSSKRIYHEFFALSLRVGEYANISLTGSNLTYDANTYTYSLTMDSGNSYNISYSISSNTSYVLVFSLTNPNQSSFVSIDDNGYIQTNKTSEDKVVKISITLMGANGPLNLVFLEITLIKSDDVVVNKEFEVINLNTSNSLKDNDSLTLYVNQELLFETRYDNTIINADISLSDSNIVEVNNTSNKIKGLMVGSSEVTFKYDDKQITITVNVVLDKMVSLKALNEGSDFIIINGTLHYLNKMSVVYESKLQKEITDFSLIKTTISDKDDTYKTVLFEYEENGSKVQISYDVKYYVAEKYNELITAYSNNDFFTNYYIGTSKVLPNKGTVKMLVIPVWFNDSDVFFKESQKYQIVEDIVYTVKGNRPDSEFKSLKQYYEAQSHGAITMDITVSDFYSSTTSYQNYTDNIQSKLTNTHKLGTDAINWYFNTHANEKFDDYDLDSDGFLDGVIIYYGANYYGATNDLNRSTAFEITNNYNNSYNFNTLSFCSIGDLYGLSKKKPTTQLTSNDLSETFAKGFKTSGKTVIHEVGHMFGNNDLYEDQFATERYSPAGGFSMQDDNFGSLDPYHLNRIGWSKPQVYASSDYNLGDKITLNISDFQSSGQNIILTNKWNSANSLYDEYLLLELFTPTGLNKYDSEVSYLNTIDSGIRLWHVNALLEDIHDPENKTSEIVQGNQYRLANSNHSVEYEYDILHMIRNNPNEPYDSTSKLSKGGTLFETGDSFDMETFKSQFVNGSKLDSGEKLGWAFKVESIYQNADGTYGAIITLERTDNVRTEFSKKVTLNRNDLNTPTDIEDYSEEIFGSNSEFELTYKYVTPPSFYSQDFPISSNGMCLFASDDGNGGYIDLTIKEIDGKEVIINSISITYSYLTNASLTVIANNKIVEGQEFETENDQAYGYEFVVNSNTVRIQNQYNGTIDHWSVLALYELTINYTIK